MTKDEEFGRHLRVLTCHPELPDSAQHQYDYPITAVCSYEQVSTVPFCDSHTEPAIARIGQRFSVV